MMEAQAAQMQKRPLVMISGKNSSPLTHVCASIFCAFLSCRYYWVPYFPSAFPNSNHRAHLSARNRIWISSFLHSFKAGQIQIPLVPLVISQRQSILVP
ncbi:unnamed protein product [Gulo gulo]|uniref:Uncharacterized protein n=1 Tax=Gulo gulo TaxID=48420 RepID=A0A9X9M8K1_GULGU|nr:unnamed protein product [Gulo gulo]